MKPLSPIALLHGPYRAPRLHVGDRAFCLYRDCNVIITNWTDARISWPRCRAVDSRGGSGLLVDDELARAIRHESATAIRYWWAVGEKALWNWRRVLGVTRTSNEGSRRLIRAAAAAGAQAVKAHEWTAAERQARRQQAKRLDLQRYIESGYHGPRWTPEQLALVGTRPDAEVAQLIGRSVEAVRIMRNRLEKQNPKRNT